MGRALLSDDEFITLYRTEGPERLADISGISIRRIYKRAANMRRDGIPLEPPHASPRNLIPQSRTERVELEIENGFVLVVSDLHLWPGDDPLMLRALRFFAKELKPKAIVLNGDVMDFPTISRFPASGTVTVPEVEEEIEFAQDVLHNLALSAPRGCRKIWTLGNHDKRFPQTIATRAPGFAKLRGFQLKDHFPAWEPCWSGYVNPEKDIYSCLITHRFKGGIHDVHNNLVWTGNHVVTGHTHNPFVRALTYYNRRTIWGMNTGCVADEYSRAFEYLEDNPRNWRQAMGILRWQDGKLMQPQLVLRWDERRVQLGTEILTP